MKTFTKSLLLLSQAQWRAVSPGPSNERSESYWTRDWQPPQSRPSGNNRTGRTSSRDSKSFGVRLLVYTDLRHSMEVSLDELSHMKNLLSSSQSIESNQSQKDCVDASRSEMKTESRWGRGLRSSGLPILKPPPSLSKEAVGQAPITVEAHVYRSMVQDITVFKTLLHRLKGELQKADTVNPFESSGIGDQHTSVVANGNVQTGVSVGELSSFKEDKSNLTRENIELRDQLASLKQQLSERDAMIRRLQLQLQRSSSSTSPPNTSPMKGNSPSKSLRTDV